MDERFWVYSAAIAVQALLALGQISLKVFAERLGVAGFNVLRDMQAFLYVGGPALSTGLIYALVMGLWLYVLQNIPVNRAFLFVSLAFLFVPLFSWMLLGERISGGTILGTIFIVAGITIGALF